jgi:hypothetical protein
MKKQMKQETTERVEINFLMRSDSIQRRYWINRILKRLIVCDSEERIRLIALKEKYNF